MVIEILPDIINKQQITSDKQKNKKFNDYFNDILNKYSLNYLDRNIKIVSQDGNNKINDNIGEYYEKYKKLLT